MSFSLRQLLGFFSIISVACALTQVSPVYAVAALFLGCGITYFILERLTWRYLFCCILIGIVVYTIAYVSLAQLFDPASTSPNQRKVDIGLQNWIGSTKPLFCHTLIPIGSLLGLMAGICYWSFRQSSKKPIKTVSRMVLYTALFVSMICVADILNYSISSLYSFGRLFVVEFQDVTPIRYPENPVRLLAIRLTKGYMAISYPLLIILGFLVIFAAVWGQLRRNWGTRLD